MRSDRTSLFLAVASVTVLVGVAMWGFLVDPVPGIRWLFLATGLPLMWGYVEVALTQGHGESGASAIITFHRFTIAWAGLLLASQFGFPLATSAGLLDIGWVSTGRHFSGVLLGAGLVVFGNHLPRLASPWRQEDEPFEWQRVHRFAGWVFVLGGLGVAGSWMILPASQAAGIAMFILGLTGALACGRKLISLASHPRARTTG